MFESQKLFNQNCKCFRTLYESLPQLCARYQLASMCVRRSFLAARWLEKHRKYDEHEKYELKLTLFFKVVSRRRQAIDTTNKQVDVTDDVTSTSVPNASVGAL